MVSAPKVLMNGATRPLSVLLAEDDENDYSLMQRMFSKSSTPVIKLDWARTYEEALKRIQEENHDVYLLDTKLAGGTGPELLKELMARKSDKPVILLTGAENNQ